MRISDWSSDVCSSDLMDRGLQVTGQDGKPGVVLVVGVNGAGRTTTVGKISRILVADERSVVLGAADTFRAAAVEQLATWGERVGVPVVKGPDGSDPASVAFEAVKQGVEQGTDRSEEHTSELQSLMRISYAVFCLKKKQH